MFSSNYKFFYSINFESLGIMETSLDDLTPYPEANWTNYPKGVMWSMTTRGYKFDVGFDYMIYGNIPNGSGLSSSASVLGLIPLIASISVGAGI